MILRPMFCVYLSNGIIFIQAFQHSFQNNFNCMNLSLMIKFFPELCNATLLGSTLFLVVMHCGLCRTDAVLAIDFERWVASICSIRIYEKNAIIPPRFLQVRTRSCKSNSELKLSKNDDANCRKQLNHIYVIGVCHNF